MALALGCGGGGGSASTPASPAFTTTAPTTATVGRVYAYQAAASEAGSTVTLTAPTLPDGAAFTAASGTLTWTPTYAQAGSAQAFVLTATDSAGRSIDQGQLGLGRSIRSLVPLQAALGPAVTCLSAWPLPAAVPNGPATISFFPVDPGGAALTWTATLTSGGGSLSSASGGLVASDSQVLLTFTPSADATATVSIQVMSCGQGHPTATRSIPIPVTVPN